MAIITFNPNDPATRAFLQELGVGDAVLNTGKIDFQDLSKLDLSEKSLLAIAALNEQANEETNGSMNIEPSEVEKILPLIRVTRSIILPLFKADRCPGKSSGATILYNILDPHFEHHSLMSEVLPEKTCRYDQARTPEEQYDIHYVDEMAPELQRYVGSAVVKVLMYDPDMDTNKSLGSAVRVSNDGTVLTARHVLYEKPLYRDAVTNAIREGREFFREGLFISDGGQEIPITEANVVRADKTADVVILRFEELASVEKIGMRFNNGRLSPDDTVWIIGFPGQFYKEDGGIKKIPEKFTRTYSVGRIRSVSIENGNRRIETTAQATFGYSGGALVDERGRLLGIVGSIGSEQLDKHPGGMTLSSFANMPLDFFKRRFK